MPERGTVTWLHLSDLHLCEPHNGKDRYEVVKTLISDLQLLRDEEKLHPDFLFVTGDLAYGNLGKAERSLPSQYAEVQRFINDVRRVFSPHIPPSRVFLVPGNHDVNRAEAAPLLTSWLNKQADLHDVEHMVTAADGNWRLFIARLREYRQFLEHNRYNHLVEDPERLIYGTNCRVNGVNVAVVGLNSAWACSNDTEDRIAVGGRRQIDRFLPQIDRAHLRIALMHHPMHWLRVDEVTRFEEQLVRRFDFFLHGHEHKPFIDPRDHFHRIAAGATYQQGDDVTDENSYNVVRLDLAKGKGRVWLREFRDSVWGGKRVGNYTTKDGVWKLDHSLRKVAARFKATAPPEPSTAEAAAVYYERTAAGRLRFLLAQTSEKRWLFPKKKIDGDVSRTTALRAANEESGAIGKLRTPLLAHYEYRRSGDVLMTDAYLFEVQELKPLKPKEEERRRPTWFTPEEAVQRLMNGRQPHEWWPLVSVLREAWLRLEKN